MLNAFVAHLCARDVHHPSGDKNLNLKQSCCTFHPCSGGCCARELHAVLTSNDRCVDRQKVNVEGFMYYGVGRKTIMARVLSFSGVSCVLPSMAVQGFSRSLPVTPASGGVSSWFATSSSGVHGLVS